MSAAGPKLENISAQKSMNIIIKTFQGPLGKLLLNFDKYVYLINRFNFSHSRDFSEEK